MGNEGHFSRTCAHCCYWDSQSDSEGLCRVAAPRSHVVGEGGDEFIVRALWPRTRSEDWCGRWKGTSAAVAAVFSRAPHNYLARLDDLQARHDGKLKRAAADKRESGEQRKKQGPAR